MGMPMLSSCRAGAEMPLAARDRCTAFCAYSQSSSTVSRNYASSNASPCSMVLIAVQAPHSSSSLRKSTALANAGSVPSCLQGLGNAGVAMAASPAPSSSALAGESARSLLSSQSSLRRRSKAEVAAAFIANLRSRGSVDVDAPGFVEDLRQHFETLPSRWGARGGAAKPNCLPLSASTTQLPPTRPPGRPHALPRHP